MLDKRKSINNKDVPHDLRQSRHDRDTSRPATQDRLLRQGRKHWTGRRSGQTVAPLRFRCPLAATQDERDSVLRAVPDVAERELAIRRGGGCQGLESDGG